MIGIVGYLAIIVTLVSAVTLAMRGVRLARRRVPAVNLAADTSLRGPAVGVLAGAVATFLALELALVTHDFSIAYVANNSSEATPLIFTIASGWAALEGSIGLWGLVLAAFTWLVTRSIKPDDRVGAGAVAVLAVIGLFFYGLMATVANPFAVCARVTAGVCTATSAWPIGGEVAAIGVGANPLLQNHILMAVHPPMLYIGYVGFSVPFAFAISALALQQPGSRWLERTHRWTLIAWTFLTLGIILGGWWSYEVLGWGGYWAWDPVENAAFLPWLVGTAFIHSGVVQRRRGMLQAWNLVLVISMFALTILGTFLTRSGVVASVHSFTQSSVGPALLAFLAVVVIGSLVLFATRVHVVASAPRLDSLVSREGVFLGNNLLLTLFAFTVLAGTLAPLVVEAFTGRAATVGEPFFNRAAIPMSFGLLLLMGIGPVTPYRLANTAIVWSRVRTPTTVGLVAGAGAVVLGVRSVPVVVVVVLGVFVLSVIVSHFAGQLRPLQSQGLNPMRATGKILKREPGYWGGQIAHAGVALLAIGIAASSALGTNEELTLNRGSSVEFEGYTLTYDSPFLRNEPNRTVTGARITVTHPSRRTRVMEPRVHRYAGQRQAVGTPDVWTGVIEDFYLSLAAEPGDRVIVDVFRFPLTWLIWFGGGVIGVGGLWSISERRRTSVADSQQTPAVTA